MSFLGFNEAKFKAQLKMAIQRIKLVNNKIENEVKRLKREIAGLLNKPLKEEEKAKIKCEHLIRGDHTIAAHCVLELLCEALIARVKLISHTKKCPEDLLQAVSTIIYCSTRVDIPELKKIKKMLQAKYKKTFVQRALLNADYNVNTKVIQKLNLSNPKEGMVRNYLKQIAEEYGFVWEPEEEKDAMGMVGAPVGRDVNPAAATGFRSQYGPDGAPIIYDNFNPNAISSHTEDIDASRLAMNAGMNAANNLGMGGNMGNMTTPVGMPLGPPPPQQQQALQFGQQQVSQQPVFAEHQNAYPSNNPQMVGTFGVNPKNQSVNDDNHVNCPTCGTMVHPSQINNKSSSNPSQQVTDEISSNVPSLPGPPTETQYVTDPSSLSPPPPESDNMNIATANYADDFGIPMAPTGTPNNNDDLPLPPASNSTNANNDINPDISSTTSDAAQGEDGPGMDELMARFNNLMQ